MKKITVQKTIQKKIGKAGTVGECDLFDCVGEGCPALGKASKADQVMNPARTLNVAKLKGQKINK